MSGKLGATALAGSVAGSSMPIAVTLFGAAAGAGAYFVLEGTTINGKSSKDWVKEWLYKGLALIKGEKMNIKKISIKNILLCCLPTLLFSSTIIMVSYASPASIVVVIVLVSSYIAGELFLLKQKINEEEKDWLHVGLSNLALSISFIILAIAFLMFGYGKRGLLLGILYFAIYSMSGVLFTALYLKRTRANGRKGKSAAGATTVPIVGAMIGIGSAKLFLKDLSQNTIIIILIVIGCVLSIAYLIAALNVICKFILKRKTRLKDSQGIGRYGNERWTRRKKT